MQALTGQNPGHVRKVPAAGQGITFGDYSLGFDVQCYAPYAHAICMNASRQFERHITPYHTAQQTHRYIIIL